ncbi:MAG TPA: hypothetical protein VM888_07435 [Chitinophagaceae bacterium]|jgi:hypothetical protein|nr:hypothetical protein [Chitinophagaceae bacterium]
MACTFSIAFTGDPQAIMNRAKAAVKSQGGTFESTESEGNFGVSVFGNTIKGSFTVTGQNLNVVISDKPFFVPCNTIEGYLKNQLGV